MADNQIQPAKPDDGKAVDAAKAAEAADAKAREAQIKAFDAQSKVGEQEKSKEQRDAEKAAQDADDARAKAKFEADNARGVGVGATVADAKVAAPVDPKMSAGDHFAQKFGNDPANPKPARGIAASGEVATVVLSRKTPDHPDLVYTRVHPEMVGDYERAGWNRE